MKNSFINLYQKYMQIIVIISNFNFYKIKYFSFQYSPVMKQKVKSFSDCEKITHIHKKKLQDQLPIINQAKIKIIQPSFIKTKHKQLRKFRKSDSVNLFQLSNAQNRQIRNTIAQSNIKNNKFSQTLKQVIQEATRIEKQIIQENQLFNILSQLIFLIRKQEEKLFKLDQNFLEIKMDKNQKVQDMHRKQNQQIKNKKNKKFVQLLIQQQQSISQEHKHEKQCRKMKNFLYKQKDQLRGNVVQSKIILKMIHKYINRTNSLKEEIQTMKEKIQDHRKQRVLISELLHKISKKTLQLQLNYKDTILYSLQIQRHCQNQCQAITNHDKKNQIKKPLFRFPFHKNSHTLIEVEQRGQNYKIINYHKEKQNDNSSSNLIITSNKQSHSNRNIRKLTKLAEQNNNKQIIQDEENQQNFNQTDCRQQQIQLNNQQMLENYLNNLSAKLQVGRKELKKVLQFEVKVIFQNEKLLNQIRETNDKIYEQQLKIKQLSSQIKLCQFDNNQQEEEKQTLLCPLKQYFSQQNDFGTYLNLSSISLQYFWAILQNECKLTDDFSYAIDKLLEVCESKEKEMIQKDTCRKINNLSSKNIDFFEKQKLSIELSSSSCALSCNKQRKPFQQYKKNQNVNFLQCQKEKSYLNRKSQKKQVGSNILKKKAKFNETSLIFNKNKNRLNNFGGQLINCRKSQASNEGLLNIVNRYNSLFLS